MRTTVRLDDALLGQVKQYAAKRRTTLTAVIEEALRETLARQHTPKKRGPIRLTTCKGKGLLPGVDLDDTASLIDAMEEASAASATS